VRRHLRVIAFPLIKASPRPAVLLARLSGYLNLHARAPQSFISGSRSFVLLSGHRLLHALSASLFKISCAIQFGLLGIGSHRIGSSSGCKLPSIWYKWSSPLHLLIAPTRSFVSAYCISHLAHVPSFSSCCCYQFRSLRVGSEIMLNDLIYNVLLGCQKWRVACNAFAINTEFPCGV